MDAITLLLLLSMSLKQATKVHGKPMPISIADGPGALEVISAVQWDALVEDCDVSGGVFFVISFGT